MHGYDVVDHRGCQDDLGRRRGGLDRLAETLHRPGLGVLVGRRAQPHGPARAGASQRTAVGRARMGRARRTRTGSTSTGRRATADLPAGAGRAARRGARGGEITVDGRRRAVLRYHDHVFPLAAGTESLDRAASRSNGQHYAAGGLAGRRTRLNYRRFFDVDTLIAVRVEDPEVFDATHAHAARPVHAGAWSTGSGSTTPTGWPTRGATCERLRDATGGAWVVVEKILEGDEALPADVGVRRHDRATTRSAGSHGVLVDPAGAGRLDAAWRGLAG